LFGEEFGVDVVLAAVDVDIAAGEMGEQEIRAVVGNAGKQIVDMVVLGALKDALIAGVFEIFGVYATAMGAVEDQRPEGALGRFWFFDGENAFHRNIYALLVWVIKSVR